MDPRIRKHLLLSFAKYYIAIIQGAPKRGSKFASLARAIQYGRFHPQQSDLDLVDNFVSVLCDFEDGYLMISKKYAPKGLAPLLATEIMSALAGGDCHQIQAIEVRE
jgi:hypothetical protein